MASTDDVYGLVAQILDKLEDMDRELKRIKRKVDEVSRDVKRI